MRILLVAALALSLLTLPSAGAILGDVRAPTLVVVYQTVHGALLSWSPVVTADHYVIMKGPRLSNMTKIHEGDGTLFMDATETPWVGVTYYSISAVSHDGTHHTTTVRTETKGDCLAFSTSLSVALKPYNCIHLIPQP